jgi:hypothetical protein
MHRTRVINHQLVLLISLVIKVSLEVDYQTIQTCQEILPRLKLSEQLSIKELHNLLNKINRSYI